MRDTKVYLVLQNLSNRERGKFLKYIQSPYFNKNQPLVELFKIINKDLGTKSPKTLERSAIWKKLQANQSYDDVRFRKYLSDLLKLVENFLALQVYEGDEFIKTNSLLEAIVEKKMEKLYSTIKKNTLGVAQRSKIQNAEYFLFQYKSKKFLHDIESDNEKKVSTNFTELSDFLDIYYFSEKFRLSYDAQVWKRLDGKLDADIGHIEEISNFLDDETLLNKSPSLSIYYSMHMLTQYPDQNEYYYEFKKQLDSNIHYFPSHETIPIYTAGINHCIRKLNSGDSSFLEELFSIYKGYVKFLVEDSNQLSQWTFNNVITVALRLGHYDWVKSFIADYGPYINEKYRENSVTYNTASYHFYLKEYDSVIKVLRNIEYEDIYYSLNSKTTLLMTYYENDDYDPLYFLFESFRAYLNRNKAIPESKKINYKNLIKVMKKLAGLPPGDKSASSKLKKEIQESPRLPLRNWLLEKIAELE